MITPVRRILLPLAACLLAASCGRHEGSRVLGESEFASVYTRLVRGGSSVREVGSDTALARGRAAEILRASGVSREEVEATVRWYNDDVTRWKGFYDEVMRIAADSIGR
jgi:hypothetical protein